MQLPAKIPKREIKTFNARLEELACEISQLEIRSDNDLMYAADVRKRLGELEETVENEWGQREKRIWEAYKTLRQIADPIRERISKKMREAKANLWRVLDEKIISYVTSKTVNLEAQLDQARQALLKGDFKQARELLGAVLDDKPVVKVNGLSIATTWTAEVTNMAELVRAVADGEAPLELLTVNTSKLNELARQHKLALGIPGVKALPKFIVRS